ncbi:MAG: DUF5804 family protein [Halobacteriaceae archaeon]
MAPGSPDESATGMTEVCLVATEDVGEDLATELLDSPTARAALSAYELREPFANAIALETISLGAAMSLLNDLDWYLTRYVQDALVRVPSISETEYLSRPLARAVREGAVDPADTGARLKVYGVERRSPDDEGDAGGDTDQPPGEADAAEAAGPAGTTGHEEDAPDSGPGGAVAGSQRRAVDVSAGTAWLVEPLYVSRTDGTVPSYDLRPVVDTLVVRITADEFA